MRETDSDRYADECAKRQAFRGLPPPGYFALKAGAKVKVKHCAGGYPLPAGLEPGTWVKIISFDCGYYNVEAGGRTFIVSMTNIDTQ
jgi:hypothetical protein